MAKPICVAYLEDFGNVTDQNDTLIKVQELLQDKFPDYHVLVLPYRGDPQDVERKTLRLEVFYEKDFTVIQYHELKNMIQDALTRTRSIDQTILGEGERSISDVELTAVHSDMQNS